jgi:uncharacterized protein (TIGR03435 family)
MVRVMTEHVARRLNRTRKLLLRAAGVMAVTAPIAFGLTCAAQAGAQSQANDVAARLPAFEVVSIRPGNATDYSGYRQLPDGLSVDGSVMDLVVNAYAPSDNTRLQTVSGMPEWARSVQFHVEAKMDADTATALRKLPGEQEWKQRQLMLQALLADRFKLKIHHETKEQAVYALVVAKGGFKMKTSSADAPSMSTGSNGRYTATAMAIGGLIGGLSGSVDRPIVDKTGLTGSYNFTLKWTPDGQEETVESGPPLFTALQEQLGLKLELAKAPIDIIVVDHIEKPSEN